MKKALISPLELVYDYEGNVIGERVAQVVNDGETFPVAESLYWKDCADDVVADQFWYDPSDQLIKANPVVVVEAPPAPTAEELAAQLAAIQAQLEAL